MGHFLNVVVLLATLALGGHCQQQCFYNGAATRSPGQTQPNLYFVIGGLFDVHEKGETAFECSTTMSEMGVINVLAFFWGIQKYASLVETKGVTVGAVALDSCMRADQSIDYVLSQAQGRLNVQGIAKENVVAYVGPYMNEDARRTGALASDLKTTLFSPTANAMDLSAMNQRTSLYLTPSFMYDLEAVVQFLNYVQTGFVMVVYSGNSMFWNAAYERFKMIRGDKLCIQYAVDYDNTPMNYVVGNLTSNERYRAKYIVPLMSKTDIGMLMSNLSNGNMRFNFILTSNIGRDRAFLTSKSITANNAIIVDQDQFSAYDPALNEFKDYVQKILDKVSNGTLAAVTNPWLEAARNASKIPTLMGDTVRSPLLLSAQKTIMSVNAIIRGMDRLMTSCSTSNYQFCSFYRNLPTKTSEIYNALRVASGIHMANSGDLAYGSIKYSYYHYFVGTNGPEIAKVGSFSVQPNGVGSADLATFDVSDKSTFGSSCNATNRLECCELPTTTPMPTTPAMTSSPSGSMTTPATGAKKDSMVRYPMGQEITGAYTDEYRSDEEYGVRFDIGHKWIIALGVLAGLGILCVIIFEIYILYKLLGTRLGNNWRTMWLGQLLLFGIFLCYLVLFAYLPIPTKATCGIIRFGVGVSYAFCFAVLLVKLMVILTSKPSDVLLPGDVESPNYLKGIYQFLMFIFAVGVQVVIDVQWLIIVPPEAVKVTSNTGDMVWICNHYTWEAGKNMTKMDEFVRTNFENHLMSLIYIMVMIVITTVLSLNAHGIITNHRESVFIGIAAGFSIPIWLAWGLTGGLNRDHEYAQEFGDACIAFGLFLTATLILFAMFLPKVRQLVNMGVEGIYLEDDRDTYYAGSVIMAPPSYKSKGPGSIIYVNNNQGIYSEPVVLGNGDPMATHLKHPGSVYSVPNYPSYVKRPESAFGGSTRVLRVTDDLRGRPPQKRPHSEIGYSTAGRPRSHKGTLPRSRSQTNLGAL